MNQEKIGKFIAAQRKEAALTQMQLAEQLGITDRAVSKWETGKSLPDSSIMLDLCKILNITVNDLLNGEVIDMKHNTENSEKLIIDIIKQKEEADKKLLMSEIFIGISSIIILLSFVFVASLAQMVDWLRILLCISGLILALPGLIYAIKIEQTAGYYECAHCHHKYVPSFKQVLFAAHVNRTRYMKCPVCRKKPGTTR